MGVDKKYMPTIMIILVGTFVGSLTQTLLTSALPKIVADLGISVGLGQWLTTIYLLVIGIMVPTTSFLIGRFSTRQLFYTCMSFFSPVPCWRSFPEILPCCFRDVYCRR